MPVKRWWRHIKTLALRKKKSPGDIPEELVNTLPGILGFTPRNWDWYAKALTHPFLNIKDAQGRQYNYDRLEFLGDAVLSLAVSEYLFRQLPGTDEGKLSDLRSKIVSRKNLNRIGRSMNLKKFFKGLPPRQLGENLEGNVVEALIGAVYMDLGFDKARTFVMEKILLPHTDLENLQRSIASHKNALYKWAQKHGGKPYFRTEKEIAENGEKIFISKLYIDGKFIAYGKSRTKKRAEEIAARYALRKLGIENF